MKRFPLPSALRCLVLLIMVATQVARGQTLPVSGYNTLVQALNSGATVITNFSTNTSTVTIAFNSSNYPAITISNNVTIDATSNSVIFQGDGTTRFFNILSRATLRLINVELTNGVSTNGGAILNAGTLMASNCVFANNVARNADGLPGGNGPLGGEGNGTNGGPGGSASGGAIYSTGALIVAYSIFTNNYALAGNGGNGGNGSGGFANGGSAGYGGNAYGGAIFNSGGTNIFYMTEFINNQCRAGNGGAGGHFATNIPPYSGSGGPAGVGGSCAGGAILLTGPLSMSNCLVANNFVVAGASGPAEVDSNGGGAEGSPGGAAEGGGVYLAAGAPLAVLTNSTFYYNTCYGGAGGMTALNAATGGSGGPAEGGGIWSAASAVHMGFCTVASNFLSGGAAGTNSAGGFSGVSGAENGWDILRSAGSFQLSSSILAVDYAGTNYPNAVGVTDEGYNVCSDSSLTKSTIVPTTKLNSDARLSGLAANGPQVGGTFGSPMAVPIIPANSPAANFIPGVPGATFPATDQIQQARGTPTSAGAYEAAPIAVQSNATLAQITGIAPAGVTLTGNGGTVTFTASVNTAAYSNANALPLGYQWLLNGTNVNNNANYSGATSNVLTIKNITIANEGYYSLIASPTLLEGYITNTNVELVLTNLPHILGQPVSQLGRPSGSQVAFTVNVEGAQGFDYQWLLNGTNLPDSAEYQVDGNVLVISPATAADEGTYSVIISNAFNSNAVETSKPARLTIVPDHSRPSVAITSPPAGIRTNSLIMSGTTQDNAQVQSVLYWITNINGALGTNVCASGQAILATNGNTNLNATPNKLLWNITTMPWPGTNILAVQAMDYSSNLSPVVTRKFFYEVPSTNFTLTKVSAGGQGNLTGHAFIHGDTAPTNSGAPLNIGEGYSLVASPDSSSLLGTWAINNGNSIVITNGNTLKFVMQSNTAITATFVSNIFLTPGVRGAYNGLFYVQQMSNQLVTNGTGTNTVVSTNEIVSNLVSFDSSGMLDNLVVGRNGGFNGKILAAGGSYGISGTFNALGQASNLVVNRGGNSPLIVSMSLSTNGAGTINGTVSNESWTTNSTLWADLGVATSGTTNFTLLLLSPANSSLPPGDGYALLQDHNGSVNFTGGLADGAALAQSVPASQQSYIPVYISLYHKTGMLFGWLNLTNLNSSNSMNGLTWINGTTNTLETQGGAWTNPGSITLPTNDALIVSNSSLYLDYPLQINGNNKIVSGSGGPSNSLTGTINLKNGQLVVTFGNGNGHATTKGYGAILQSNYTGGGYFATRVTNGLILLQPMPTSTNGPVPQVAK